MNKSLESIRGSWIIRDREEAEANRIILHKSIDQIPTDLQEKFVSVLVWADSTEEWNDAIMDVSCKNSERQIREIMFLEEQMKLLIEAIRVTKDVESIRQLRTTTREMMERMGSRKREQEQERLAGELALRGRI